MKTCFTHVFKSLIFASSVLVAQSSFAQVDTFFIETMGPGTGTLEIEDAPFDNLGIVEYSGFSVTSRATNPSTTARYALASGDRNIIINAADAYFRMDGIVIENYTDIQLQLGMRKSTIAEDGSSFRIYAIIGTDTTTLIPSLPTGTGSANWHFITGLSIPDGDTLSLIFTRISGSTEFRVDDVRLFGVDNPLSVSLLEFNASTVNNTKHFSWITAQEKELSHFILEGSVNGQVFMPVANISAYNSPNGAQYNYVLSAQDNNRFYRLKSVDFDGSVSYSKVVALDIQETNQISLINTKAENNIVWVNNPFDLQGFAIYNMMGQQVSTGQLTQGVQSIDLSHLADGQYIFQAGNVEIRFVK